MEVAGNAVDGRVHVHRGDDDAVAEFQAAQPQRSEHRRGAGGAAELLLDGGGEAGVAQPQVVVGDAAAAGQQVEGELAGRLVDVRTQLLEPAQARCGGALGGGDDGPPLGLVRGEGCGQVRLLLDTGGERQGVLDGELGAGADREVGGVGGVADEDRVAVRPVGIDDGTEGEPGGVVGAQRAAAEGVGEDLAAAFRRCCGVHGIETGRAPDLLAHLDDGGGGTGREGVGVQLHHAVFGLGDLEAEGVEREVRGEPDVAVAVGGDGGPEDVGVRLTGGAVHPVGRDHQVVRRGELGDGRGLRAEAEPYPEGGAALVQDLQEPAAAQRREAVAAGRLGPAAVDDVDVVPPYEFGLEGPVDHGVGVFDAAERLVGEDDAEAECVVGGVALPDGDGALGVQALEEGRGVQPAGAAADDRDPPRVGSHGATCLAISAGASP